MGLEDITLHHLDLARAQRSERFATSLDDSSVADSPASDEQGGRDDIQTRCVSVVIPTLNAAETVGDLVRLVHRHPLVLEVVVVDSGSIDETTELAAGSGARVMMSSLQGKGASLRDGIAASNGEIILFVDGDLLEIGPDFVDKMIDPILTNRADLVKARFTRDVGGVTILTGRPLLAAFFPELADFAQPLGGILAARRSLLRNIRLESDLGADVGLLIDAVARDTGLAEADIGRIDYKSPPLETLGEMARQVTRVILDRAWRYERFGINQVLQMQESERRAKAQQFPVTCCSTHRDQRFALFEMDGVLLDGWFAAELARKVGVESEFSRFLDNKSLPDDEKTRTIASLFAGVHWDVFEETALSMPLAEGAVETVIALRKAGYQAGIVTDGFHVAADIVRRRVFADFSVAHVMNFRNCTATGELTPSPLMTDSHGCREHKHCKSNVVRRLQDSVGLQPERTLAVGSGESDLCMLKAVGTAIAFRPQSRLLEEVATHTIRGSLLEILELPELSDTSRVRPRRPSRMTSPLRKASFFVEQLVTEEAG